MASGGARIVIGLVIAAGGALLIGWAIHDNLSQAWKVIST